MKEKVIELIKNIIRENNEADSSIDILESSKFSDLGLSSFDLATLTVEIEDIYGIDIFENGIISTVGEVFEILEQ